MRILILFALLGSTLAMPMDVSRIVGGSTTTVDQYPYMANMQHNIYSIWWVQECGGTLLTRTVVLSAAHCFEDDDPPSSWRALLGTSYAENGGSIHPVSRIVNHPDYDLNLVVNDISVVHLAVPAVYSANVQPARIPSSNYNVPDGAVVTAIGWGLLGNNIRDLPEQLQHVDVSIINQELCAERYAYLKTQPGFAQWPAVTEGMLCSGVLDVGGKGQCHGDSGGPLVYGDVVVGVTSWSYRCTDPMYPTVNARVSHYSDWIVANT